MRQLIYLILIFLMACSAEQSKKSSAKFSISTRNFATGAAAGDSSSSDPMILYLINKTAGKQQVIEVTDQLVSVDLDFGRWEIVVLNWRSGYQQLYCGRVTKDFNQEFETINLELSQENCNSTFFSSAAYKSENALKIFNLINCKSSSSLTPNADTLCSPANRGGASSYRVNFITHDYMAFNNIRSLNLNSSSMISSPCIDGAEYPETTTPVSYIPFGSSDFRLPILIETFEDDNCSGASSETYFPNGLGSSALTGGTQVITNDAGNFLFIPFQGSYLVGKLDFGTIEVNNTLTQTFYFTNTTGSSLSNLNFSTFAPFSIQPVTCQGFLAKNSSCLIEITYSPLNAADDIKNLTITFISNNIQTTKTYSLTGIGSLPNLAPVVGVHNGVHITEDDQNTLFQLHYTDNENDLAVACSVTNPVNAQITKKCFCNLQGQCYVHLVNEPNNTQNGSFDFTVTTANGDTSNPGTINFIVDPVGDTLIAKQIVRKLPNAGTTANIFLYYDSPDGLPPTTCSAGDFTNVTQASACSCTNNGVTTLCSVQITATGTGHGGFRYTVTNASGESNIANVMLFSNEVNKFVTVPQNFTTFSGLATNQINHVLETLAGYLHVSTNLGFSQSIDNGLHWRTLTTANGLGSNMINASYVSSPYIYLATENGLAISNNGGETFTNKLENTIVRNIHVDSDGFIYASTENGLYASFDLGTSFTQFPGMDVNQFDLLKNGTPVTSDDIYFIAHTDGIQVINYSVDPDFVGDHLAGKNIKSVDVDSNGNVWAAASSGEIYFYDHQNEFFIPIFTLPTNTFSMVKGNAELFLVNNDQITIYIDGATPPTTITSLSDVTSLSFNSINNKVWAATDGGVYVSSNDGDSFSVNATSSFPLSSSTTIFDVTKGPFGKIYLATEEGVLISSDHGNSFTQKTTSDGLTHNTVHSVFVTADNTLWAATQDGLTKMDAAGNVTDVKYTQHGLGDDHIYDIAYDYTQGIMYVGTANGLSISTDKGETFSNTEDGNSIYRVIVDENGHIYTATQIGVGISTNGAASFRLELNNTSINDIAVSSDGVHIFAATSSGLWVSNDSGTNFSLKGLVDGLPAIDVTSLYLDRNNVLYVGTVEGLGISTNLGYNFISYDVSDGISEERINRVFVDNYGAIFLGTDNGLSAAFSTVLLGLTDQNGTPVSSIDFGTPGANLSINFLIKNFGNTATKTLTYSLSADSDIRFTAPAPAPPACTSILLPSNSCSVSVNWTEQGAGPATGSLLLIDETIELGSIFLMGNQ